MLQHAYNLYDYVITWLELMWLCYNNIHDIGRGGCFGTDGSLYSHRSQLIGRLWVRLPLPNRQFSSRFNSRPIMLFLYHATWNKGMRLLSVLKLWSIVETITSKNDGITVIQTVAHTIQLWPHGLSMPCGWYLSRKRHNNSLCLSQAAAIVPLAHT